MGNISLYRKYRPSKLSEVVGQEHITRTLANQIKNSTINHAYLFCGSRGVGKTSIARIFAKAINCPNEKNGEPCLNCETCDLLSHDNLDVIEIDAASNNKVEEIRELKEKVKFPPINTKRKVYIIDEVHMLSDSAFNALLKTLEEPPEYVVFILATTEPQKLPATVLSRCVRFDFKLLSNKELESLLKGVFEKENIACDEASYKLIADVAQGSARDCLSIATMCASFCDNNLIYENVLNVLGAIDKNVLIDLNVEIQNHNIENVFKILNKLTTSGKGVNILIKEMISFFRDLTIIKSCKNANELVNLPTENFKRMVDFSKTITNEKIVQMLSELSAFEIEVKTSQNQMLMLEAFLIRQTLATREGKQNPVQEQKKEIKPIKTNDNFIKVFGKLLTELKNQGYMALYGLLSDVLEGEIDNGFLIAYLNDESQLTLLDKEANKNLINAIINDVLNEGYKFKTVVKNNNKKENFQALENMLGDKLKIE